MSDDRNNQLLDASGKEVDLTPKWRLGLDRGISTLKRRLVAVIAVVTVIGSVAASLNHIVKLRGGDLLIPQDKLQESTHGSGQAERPGDAVTTAKSRAAKASDDLTQLASTEVTEEPLATGGQAVPGDTREYQQKFITVEIHLENFTLNRDVTVKVNGETRIVGRPDARGRIFIQLPAELRDKDLLDIALELGEAEVHRKVVFDRQQRHFIVVFQGEPKVGIELGRRAAQPAHPEPTIAAPPQPSCSFFQADPSQIYVRESATLSFNSQHGTRATINGTPVSLVRPAVVYPRVSTKYELTIYGAPGTDPAICEAFIDVSSRPCEYDVVAVATPSRGQAPLEVKLSAVVENVTGNCAGSRVHEWKFDVSANELHEIMVAHSGITGGDPEWNSRSSLSFSPVHVYDKTSTAVVRVAWTADPAEGPTVRIASVDIEVR